MSPVRERSQQGERPRAARPDVLVFTVLAVVAVVLFVQLRLPPDVEPGRSVAPPEVADAPPARVQDFAYYMNYARWAAARPGRSPYTVEAHREFLTAWLGPRVSSSLCFAYGPALIVVLLPLFLVPTRWAWLAWNVVGAAASGWTVRTLSDDDGVARRWGLLALLGSTALLCLANGQTALVTTGWFAAAMSAGDDRRIGRQLGAVAGLAALSAKPPLAVIAAVALLVSGGVRAVVVAATAIGAVLLVAASWWTPQVFGDYASFVAKYNLVDADPIVRAGFVPWHMTNLRSMLLHVGTFDDAQAFRASAVAFGVALTVPFAIVGWCRRAWPRDVAASFAVVAYLLLAPHLSASEDVLLVVPLLLLLRARRVTGWSYACLVVGCVAPQWLNRMTVQVFWHAHPEALADALPVLTFGLKCCAIPPIAQLVVAHARPDARLSP